METYPHDTVHSSPWIEPCLNQVIYLWTFWWCESMNCIVSLSQLRQISVTCKRESSDSYTHLSRYNSITSHLKEVCPEGPQGFSLLLSPLSISFYPLLLFFSFLRVSCNTPTRSQAFLQIFPSCQAHNRYPNRTKPNNMSRVKMQCCNEVAKMQESLQPCA